MLFQKMNLCLTLVLVAYVSTAPILLEDSKKKSRIARSIGFGLSHRRHQGHLRHREPWEVNEISLSKQGRLYDGNPFFQGDIILDPDTKILLRGGSTRRKRAVKKKPAARWPNGEIPFVISRALPHKSRKEIRKAIRHWKRKTCLQFRPKRRRNDTDYIKFVHETGCWSYVGRAGGEQKISVGPGCEFVGTIIHEIGHAIGFWHEQSRRDRDDYIKIIRENIQTDAITQFDKMPKRLMDSMGYAYDFYSIMHYGSRFFSRNGKATIKIKKVGRRVGAKIGQRKGLSWVDIAQVQAMYNCNKMPRARSGQTCYNGSAGNNGQNYRGKINFTAKGVTCQPWNEQWPHRHYEMADKIQAHRDGLGRHNYCRNPGGRKSRPWCYTTLKRHSWQYCAIRACRKNAKS